MVKRRSINTQNDTKAKAMPTAKASKLEKT
jgi:hypothetical protein